jgi:hypothetical protein
MPAESCLVHGVSKKYFCSPNHPYRPWSLLFLWVPGMFPRDQSGWFVKLTNHPGGRRWRSWLRHCATSRKVTVSIPDGIIGIFHWHNPSGLTMALGLTQPLTERAPGIFSGGKGGRCLGLTILPSSCFDCLEIWEPQPPGTLRACPGL